jgi:hypothetical protein
MQVGRAAQSVRLSRSPAACRSRGPRGASVTQSGASRYTRHARRLVDRQTSCRASPMTVHPVATTSPAYVGSRWSRRHGLLHSGEPGRAGRLAVDEAPSNRSGGAVAVPFPRPAGPSCGRSPHMRRPAARSGSEHGGRATPDCVGEQPSREHIDTATCRTLQRRTRTRQAGG